MRVCDLIDILARAYEGDVGSEITGIEIRPPSLLVVRTGLALWVSPPLVGDQTCLNPLEPYLNKGLRIRGYR